MPPRGARARALRYVSGTPVSCTVSPMTTEETFTLNGAAKLTGYSLPTVRRRLPALQKAGAIQREGVWQIPLSALYAAELMSKRVSNDTPNDGGQTLDTRTPNELETLRARLTEAETRAAVAEALADERLRSLERADRALLALEQRLTDPPSVTAAPTEPQPAAQRPRRGWLERLRGD